MDLKIVIYYSMENSTVAKNNKKQLTKTYFK